MAGFNIELADDPKERSLGLMNRKSLPQSAGMLFAYEKPQAVSFWMRNTLIPLDMIFMDATGRVTHIHENAIPLDETGIPGGDDVILPGDEVIVFALPAAISDVEKLFD